MSNSASFAQLIQEVDIALAERRDLRQRGVHLIVTHLDHIPGTVCSAGETVGNIALGGFPEPVSLGLTHTSNLLIDCFCRYRMPLSASRVEEIMNTDPFYTKYGANRTGSAHVIARPDRNTTRVYVWRIHKQMAKVFQNVGLSLNPKDVLTSAIADTNVVIYKLRATAEIVHINFV